jgi:hypothetical protein
MKRLVAVLALLALTTACSSYSYLKIARMSPAQIHAIPAAELCNAFYQTRAEPKTRQAIIREEIRTRGLMTEAELQLADRHQVQMGMSRLALIAGWGYPKKMTRGLPTGSTQAAVDATVTHTQFIYEGSTGFTTISVYLENDIVTGWREWSDVSPDELRDGLSGMHSTAPGIVREPEQPVEPRSQEPQKEPSPLER